MKVGSITEHQETFSYKTQRFSDYRFIIGVRDEQYEHNVQTIVAVENKHLVDLDQYEFDNDLFAARPPYNNPHDIQDLPLSRFHSNELIKINNGSIIENSGVENPNLPRIKTFNVNVNPFNSNTIIEIFEGKINEEESLFTPNELPYFDIIKNIYLEASNSFFIAIEDKIIGPFLALKVNDRSFNIGKHKKPKFGKYELNDNTCIEFEANNIIRRIHMIGISDLSLVFLEDYEFISDTELFDEFQDDLINNAEYFNESNLETALKVLKYATEFRKVETIDKKNSRLKDLLDKGKKIISKDIDLLGGIPEIKDFKLQKEKLDEGVLAAKNLQAEIMKQNEDFLKKKLGLVDDISELESKIKNLEATKTAELENNKDDLDAEIKELEDKKKNLELEVEDNRTQLESKLDKLKKDIEYYERNRNELSTQIEALRKSFKDEQKEAQQTLESLIKSKIHFDFISGRDLSQQEVSNEAIISFKIIDKYEVHQYREFRNELLNIFKRNNREFETHFIDNLLISIFQNTLTIFAGVPGIGKTTLARLLTGILSPNERIREVAVNRGWSSQKDFIGYVNPLSKKFHSSSTDIYSLLKQLNAESCDEEQYSNSPMAFVVLDEANLSPLEHYWSSFYNLTDSSGMLEVKLGHKETVKFPNNLRFIGTINYDHTTEELSPRVLDRINIIQLNKAKEINFSNITTDETQKILLSFKRCSDFFKIPDNESLNLSNDKISQAFKVIKTEFRKLKIFVSPRVEIAIKKYITIASKYMADVNKPLDYCVAQRLLPLINLQGGENKQKLESLKLILEENKCELSIRILDEILIIGAEDGIYEDNYNYFLTLSNV